MLQDNITGQKTRERIINKPNYCWLPLLQGGTNESQMLQMWKLWLNKPLAMSIEGIPKKIPETYGNSIGDCPIIIAKILVIPEAIWVAMHLGMSNIIVESDFQVAIKSIHGQSHILSRLTTW